MAHVKPLCVGLTGGIASGKSTVANLFAALDVPIIDADVISHQLTEKNAPAYTGIAQHFGPSVVRQDNTLDRRKIREIIFNNATEKLWLENYLHPLIRQAIKNDIQKITAPYCICVIPLLAESNYYEFIDKVLVIDIPENLQLTRAKKRDHASEADIQKIICAQASREKRLSIADDVLINDGDLTSLKEKIVALDKHYRS